MPAYLVELPNNPGISGVIEGNAMIVFAASSDDAKAVADAHFGADAKDLFTLAGTATELVAETDMEGYDLVVDIYDHTPRVLLEAEGVLGVVSGAVEQAGTTYSVGDILSVAGGTATRAATFRVSTVGGSGEVTGIALIDPGHYSVTPAELVDNAVTDDDGEGDGAGSGATLAITMGTTAYVNKLGHMLTLLNAETDIEGALLDLSGVDAEGEAAAAVLTIADATDELGAEHVIVEFRKNGVAVPDLVVSVQDGDSEGQDAEDILAATIVPASTVVQPNVVRVLKQT
jgi:hypothetical protein